MVAATLMQHNSAASFSVIEQSYSKPQQHKLQRMPTFVSSEVSENLIDKRIEAGRCLVAQVGLGNFIRAVTGPLNLHMTEEVAFNMNDKGVMSRWDDVFLAEQVYTRCLGISKRTYQTHAYTHEPDNRLCYFILEERNERSMWFLPAFDYFVLVFTYYDENKAITRVDVQYDQISFFLHCLGVAQMNKWFVEKILTPCVLVWAKSFHGTGLVNPFTFLLQLLILPLAVAYYFMYR